MVEKKISICTAELELAETSHNLTASKLRGFLGYYFLEDAEFHHHGENPYHYPLVQYKRIGKKLYVIGLQEYAIKLLGKISQVDRIVLKNETVRVLGFNSSFNELDVKNQINKYEFATPWIALNEDNYRVFKTLEESKRKPFLEKILVGNVLSAFKGLGIFLDFRLEAKIEFFRQVLATAHDNTFEAFHAAFTLNSTLPELIGLGKSVSKGFGTVRKASL